VTAENKSNFFAVFHTFQVVMFTFVRGIDAVVPEPPSLKISSVNMFVKIFNLLKSL
jgi:hypothetical protein